jgi:hypothetical protein
MFPAVALASQAGTAAATAAVVPDVVDIDRVAHQDRVAASVPAEKAADADRQA